jgi:hypothetical protein
LSYLVNSFTLILAPAYAGTIFLILVLALIGELSLCLWLMVMGVNVPKWNERLSLFAKPLLEVSGRYYQKHSDRC